MGQTLPSIPWPSQRLLLQRLVEAPMSARAETRVRHSRMHLGISRKEDQQRLAQCISGFIRHRIDFVDVQTYQPTGALFRCSPANRHCEGSSLWTNSLTASSQSLGKQKVHLQLGRPLTNHGTTHHGECQDIVTALDISNTYNRSGWQWERWTAESPRTSPVWRWADSAPVRMLEL